MSNLMVCVGFNHTIAIDDLPDIKELIILKKKPPNQFFVLKIGTQEKCVYVTTSDLYIIII